MIVEGQQTRTAMKGETDAGSARGTNLFSVHVADAQRMDSA